MSPTLDSMHYTPHEKNNQVNKYVDFYNIVMFKLTPQLL